jgi:hypothetical protein
VSKVKTLVQKVPTVNLPQMDRQMSTKINGIRASLGPLLKEFRRRKKEYDSFARHVQTLSIEGPTGLHYVL